MEVRPVDIHFDCTKCGRCCVDTKIPLTVAEAIDWLGRGHEVQLLCEASPWPEDVANNDLRAGHFKRRSFAVMSGSMPARVVVVLVANGSGACPHLLADMRCGIYERRPLVCRIYPAEIHPLVRLKPQNKACPTEAWDANGPLLQRNGVLLSQALLHSIQLSRDTDALDVDVKSRLCVALNVFDAALVHEAVLMYSPAVDTLASALAFAIASKLEKTPAQWRFVSDNRETVQALEINGGVAVHLPDAETAPYRHLSSKRRALFGPYHGH